MRRSGARHAAIGVVTLLILLAIGIPPTIGQPYTVAPGDILDISVLGEPTVSGTFSVDPDGKIALPMAGGLSVGGLTLDEVNAKVTEALKPYLRNPRVTVSLRAAEQNDFVSLLGQVERPGSYKMQRGWTVADVIAAAGGTTGKAALTKAFVLRKNQVIPVDLDALIIQGKPEANVNLESGDVVIVPETKNTVQVVGAVARPGEYAFTPGQRVIDALSAAGGTVPTAKLNDIGVVREQDPAKKSATAIHLDLGKYFKNGDQAQNVPLLPGDIVYVPEKGRDWLEYLADLTGIATVIAVLR
jgi:polysaccharide biosynthesis/export protein